MDAAAAVAHSGVLGYGKRPSSRTDVPGREADLVVLDPRATPVLAFRSGRVRSIEEQLAVLMTLGDDRAVRATYVAGEIAHER